MDEIKIGFGPRERRRARMGALVFVALVGMVAVLVVSRSHGVNWFALGMLAVILVLLLLMVLKHGSGETILTPSGMVLATAFGRQTVPWERITRIEVRRRATRSGSPWLEARIHLSDANPLPLPGVVEGRSGLPKTEFQDQVGTLLAYWQRATGRTEKVLFLPR